MLHTLSQHWASTGGPFSRDIAALQCVHVIGGGWLAAGGPIDAPDYMPAGSCTSEDVRNSRGDPVPTPAHARRGEPAEVFSIGGSRCTLAELLDANDDDPDVCDWARTARPGDHFPSFAECIAIG